MTTLEELIEILTEVQNLDPENFNTVIVQLNPILHKKNYNNKNEPHIINILSILVNSRVSNLKSLLI